MKKIEYEYIKKEKVVDVSTEEIADAIIEYYEYECEDDICEDDILYYLEEEEVSDTTDEDLDEIDTLIRSKLAKATEEVKQTQKECFKDRNSILSLIEYFMREDDGKIWHLTPEEILNEILKNGNK